MQFSKVRQALLSLLKCWVERSEKVPHTVMTRSQTLTTGFSQPATTPHQCFVCIQNVCMHRKSLWDWNYCPTLILSILGYWVFLVTNHDALTGRAVFVWLTWKVLKYTYLKNACLFRFEKTAYLTIRKLPNYMLDWCGKNSQSQTAQLI